MKLRQHEVQAVSGPGGCVAAAWTDDTRMDGLHGWTCGYGVSLNGGQSWGPSLFHKRADFAVTGNPTIAVDASGCVFAVAMSADDDYARGILELSRSADAGRTWSAWTTIATKQGGIPDRPRLIAARDGNLHLVFSSVEQTGRKLRMLRSTIQYTRSLDHGETWSAPKTISAGAQRSRWFVDGYQGPAIVDALNGELLVSWADYYGNRVRFSVSRDKGAQFDTPASLSLKTLPGTSLFTWLLGATFGTPVTALTVDASGSNIVMSVHEAHGLGIALLVGSRDGGKTWSRLARLARRGTNASLAFDSTGRLHAMWTELRDPQVDVKYAISTDFGRTFSAALSLAGNGGPVVLPKSPDERDECAAALGSYQSLIIDDHDQVLAFWIDLRTGLSSPRLFQSAWHL